MGDDLTELERRAGKSEKDDHPLDEPIPDDTSDTADHRVVQPGENEAGKVPSPEQGKS